MRCIDFLRHTIDKRPGQRKCQTKVHSLAESPLKTVLKKLTSGLCHSSNNRSPLGKVNTSFIVRFDDNKSYNLRKKKPVKFVTILKKSNMKVNYLKKTRIKS